MPEQSSEEMTAQSSVAIMNRLANALEKLSSAQPVVAKQTAFKAPDFNNDGDHSTIPEGGSRQLLVENRSTVTHLQQMWK